LGDEQSEKLDLSGIPNIHLKKGTEFSVSDLVKGKYRAVFMSPEIIFQNPRVSSLWSIPEWKNRLRAVVVDEAHCIGTWGGQFRTDYAKLGHLRAKVSPSTCFVAVSATLPPVLLSEVLKTLHFSNPVIFNYGNDRTNIQLHVKQLRYKASSYQDLEFLKDGIKTIVYFDEIRQAEAAARHV
ncbi:ATP-dependent DNA helicase sgs1, partial [Lobosporangium transversale]